MTVARIAVSLDPELAEQIRAAAADDTVSGWLADAARRKLRAQGLAVTVASWQVEHGELTAAERHKARRELGLPEPA